MAGMLPLPLYVALEPWLPTTEPPVAEQSPRVCCNPAFYKIRTSQDSHAC